MTPAKPRILHPGKYREGPLRGVPVAVDWVKAHAQAVGLTPCGGRGEVANPCESSERSIDVSPSLPLKLIFLNL